MMESYKFKVGDRVRCVEAVSGNEDVKGKLGTIKAMIGINPVSYGIEFDDRMRRCSTMPPKLKTDNRERKYQLAVDGVVVATGTLQELGLHRGVVACEFITSLDEPEVTMPFEEIFKDEPK